jgi:PTH1 family peptidyl-tRNA hydrolase
MSDVLLNQNIRLITGLGNPGRRYSKTRHNVGFMVLDAMAKERDFSFVPGKGEFEIGEFVIDRRIIRAVKPITYMNSCGSAVAEAARYYRIAVPEILVVVDDANIPMGKIRIRKGGSDGGHNGLKSLIENLDSNRFPRIRIGIGPIAEGMPLEDYILSRFTDNELGRMQEIIDRAVDLVFKIIVSGIDKYIGTYTV